MCIPQVPSLPLPAHFPSLHVSTACHAYLCIYVDALELHVFARFTSPLVAARDM